MDRLCRKPCSKIKVIKNRSNFSAYFTAKSASHIPASSFGRKFNVFFFSLQCIGSIFYILHSITNQNVLQQKIYFVY